MNVYVIFFSLRGNKWRAASSFCHVYDNHLHMRQTEMNTWISIKLVQFLCSWIFFCWNFLHCNPVKMVCIETLSIQMNWIRFHIVKVLFMYPKLWYAIQILVYASAHAHCVSRHVQKRKEKKYRENITGNVKSTFVCIL